MAIPRRGTRIKRKYDRNEEMKFFALVDFILLKGFRFKTTNPTPNQIVGISNFTTNYASFADT